MADVVASIFGISSFGIKLVDTLYKFGSNFSAARDQSSRISERITDYINILDILSTTIEDEAEYISKKAVIMIQRLCDQSMHLFYDIKDHLPTRGEASRRNDISLKDRIMWNFRKSRVELLLGQLEFVKSNVWLIVMTTLVGRRIRSRRRRKSKSKGKADDGEEMKHQTVKARNAIVQHMNAGERLEKLKNEAIRADDAASASAASLGALIKSNTETAITIISHQAETITKFQNAMLEIADPADRQAFVMSNSTRLLEELLAQWTNVDLAKEPQYLGRGKGRLGDGDREVGQSDNDMAERQEWRSSRRPRRPSIESVDSAPRSIPYMPKHASDPRSQKIPSDLDPPGRPIPQLYGKAKLQSDGTNECYELFARADTSPAPPNDYDISSSGKSIASDTEQDFAYDDRFDPDIRLRDHRYPHGSATTQSDSNRHRIPPVPPRSHTNSLAGAAFPPEQDQRKAWRTWQSWSCCPECNTHSSYGRCSVFSKTRSKKA